MRVNVISKYWKAANEIIRRKNKQFTIKIARSFEKELAFFLIFQQGDI